jgi:hypothetical protein
VGAIAVATAWATSSLKPAALLATPTAGMTPPIATEDGALCA